MLPLGRRILQSVVDLAPGFLKYRAHLDLAACTHYILAITLFTFDNDMHGRIAGRVRVRVCGSRNGKLISVLSHDLSYLLQNRKWITLPPTRIENYFSDLLETARGLGRHFQ